MYCGGNGKCLLICVVPLSNKFKSHAKRYSVHTRDAIPFHWALHIKPRFTATRRKICLHNSKIKGNGEPSSLNDFQKCQPKMSKQIHLFDLFRMSQQFDLLCIPTVFRIPALFAAICNSPLSPTQKVKKTDRVATPRACQFNKCKPHRYPFLSAQEDVMFIQLCCFTTLSAVNFVHAKRERNSRLSMSWSKHILTSSKAPLSYPNVVVSNWSNKTVSPDVSDLLLQLVDFNPWLHGCVRSMEDPRAQPSPKSTALEEHEGFSQYGPPERHGAPCTRWNMK